MLDGMAQVGRRGRAPAQFVVGQVLEVGEGVLRVTCSGQELTGEDLWVNEDLLPGWHPRLTGTLTGTCSSHGGAVTVPVKASQLARAEHALTRGDRVILLTEDQQDYYLVCKVVRP